MIKLKINNKEVSVDEGTTVAAAILNLGEPALRQSVRGKMRGPLCGMGICFECRVTINGEPHSRSCMTLVSDGMEVVTNE